MRLIVRHYLLVAKIFIREPLFRGLLFAAVAVMLFGTVFYHLVEGWSWLDSLYFCTVTLATVGYGGIVPTTDVGRAFTIFYILFGFGIFASFLTAIARAPYMFDQDGPEPGTSLRQADADAMRRLTAAPRAGSPPSAAPGHDPGNGPPEGASPGPSERSEPDEPLSPPRDRSA
jgi:hypothetical protein